MKKFKPNLKEEKEKRMRALKVLEENYNKDPAFWVDVINSNADITTKKLANKKLLDVGWAIIRIGKKK